MCRAAVLIIVLAAGACGGSTRPRPSRPAVPEPAPAPALTEPPAGRVVHLGDTPEGIVVDAATGLVAVAVRNPAALAVLDRDGHTLGRIPLAGAARHLEPAGTAGRVLVPEETADRLEVVDLSSGRVVRSVPVGRNPHDAVAAAGRIFVGDEAADEVHVIGATRVDTVLSAPTQPGGVAADGSTVAVVGVRARRIETFDATTLHPLATVACGVGPTHVVATSGGRFFVADTQGDAVLSFVSRDGRMAQVARTALAGVPYGLAIDTRRQHVWVTLTAQNRVVEYQVGASALRRVRSWPTVRQPNGVAVDPATGRVYVTGTHDGLVQIFDP